MSIMIYTIVTSLALLVCVFCIVVCLSSLQFPLVFVARRWLAAASISPSPVHLRPSISVRDWLPSPLPRRQPSTLHQSPVCPSTFKPGPVYCSVASSPVCFSCRRLYVFVHLLMFSVIRCFTTCLFVELSPVLGIVLFVVLLLVQSYRGFGTGKLPMGIHPIT